MTLKLVAAVPALLVMFGCSNPSSSAPKANANDIDNALVTAGGRPGKIEFHGAGIVTQTEDVLKLNEQISFEQVAGQNSKGKPEEISSWDKTSFNLNPAYFSLEVDVLKKLETANTYVNLGCRDIDPNLINGLTQVFSFDQSADWIWYRAQKIFLCGKFNEKRIPVFYGAQVFLNEFVIENNLNENDGVVRHSTPLRIAANDLNLEGHSFISLRAGDSKVFVLDGNKVSLYVLSNLRGAGTLKIKTAGGNGIK